MRTRFKPRRTPDPTPDPRLVGTQIELGDIVLRAGIPQQHETGAMFSFTELDGWWEPPASSGETTSRVLAHGGWDNRGFYDPRFFTLKGIIWGDTDSIIEAGIAALNAVIPVDERRPFVLRRHGKTQHVMARQEDQPKIDWHGTDVAEFDIQFSASDYRKFAGEGREQDWHVHGPVSLPASRGGITFPLKFPIRSDAQTSSGRIPISLAGNAPPKEVVEFTGPVANPSVRDMQANQRLWFDITLSEGQTLTVDLGTHSVLLNGVSRRGTRRGTWIKPSANHTLEFTASSTSTDARMLVRTQEAYL